MRHLAPSGNIDALEYATPEWMEWMDWFNDRRLPEPGENIPPAELEAYYR